MFSDWSARKRLVLLKGLSKEFQMSLHLKSMLDTQQHLLIRYLSNNENDIVVFLILLFVVSDSWFCKSLRKWKL